MWYSCHQHCMNVECRRDLRYSRNMWGGTAGFRLSWNEILMHLTLALYTNEPGWSLIQVHTSVGEEEASRIIQKQRGQLRLEQVVDLRTSCTELEDWDMATLIQAVNRVLLQVLLGSSQSTGSLESVQPNNSNTESFSCPNLNFRFCFWMFFSQWHSVLSVLDLMYLILAAFLHYLNFFLPFIDSSVISERITQAQFTEGSTFCERVA